MSTKAQQLREEELTTGESELPEGWAQATLDDCSTLVTKGTTPTSLGFKYQDTGVYFVRVENLSNGIIDKASIDKFIDSATDKALGRSRLQAGDLLFSIAGTIGRTALVLRDDLPANTNQALAIIRGTSTVFIPKCLMFALSSHLAQAQAETGARGGSMSNISLEDVRALSVRIPPRREQERITKRIEELEAEAHQARLRLNKASLLLKNFRQSVLAAACSGKLTEDWRRINPCEWASLSLRKEVAAARRKAWEASKPNRRYPEPVPFDDTDLPEIPESWTWVSADEVCSQITDGEHIQPKYQSSGLPMITATHVRDGYVELENVGLISPEDFKKCLLRCAPTDNDVLVVSVGATTGRAAIVKNCPPFAMVRSALMLRPLIEPRFLLRWIQSIWCQKWISQASGASAQPHFYIHDNKRMPMPLAPSEEQEEIVRRVEALFKLADAIEKRVTATTGRAENLTQAVLAKAFRGELVPTEAELARREGREYEPASVLLERIKAEREKSAGKPKKSRKYKSRAAQ